MKVNLIYVQIYGLIKPNTDFLIKQKNSFSECYFQSTTEENQKEEIRKGGVQLP